MKTKPVWSGPATPQVERVVQKHTNLLKEMGITVVRQGTAVIEEITRRRWVLMTPDGTVSWHTSEKKAAKAADVWSDGQLDHTTKTVGVMQVDVRRKTRP